MAKVQLTETVLRDGHQSLIATRMRTADMLPILEKLDEVGYFSLEAWGGATFDVCLRYLNEDPWERLRAIRASVKKTKLQMLLRGQNLVGYRHYPDDVVVKFVERAKANGIDIFRVFDAVNDIRNMTAAIKAAKSVGAMVEGTISYTISPVHTIANFVQFAKELKELGCDIICIKDMAGLISPVAAYDLVDALKKEVQLPVHLHSHCASGMAPIAYLTACEAGVAILDTVISPFAWGTSQPPTETIVGALKGTPYDTGLNLELLTQICDYFQKVKARYQNILDPVSERVDPKIMLHQIPGGMLSNLVSQLKEQNAMDKYDAVLKEIAVVRKELGYPPLVTPTSQIVGTQAVMNVVTGERYKIICKEVKDYVKGLYGKAPGPIDEEVKKKAIGSEEPIQGRAADLLAPEYDKAKATVIALGYEAKDEDVLSYALFPQVAKDFFEKRKLGKLNEPVPVASTALKISAGAQPDQFVAATGNKQYQINVSKKIENNALTYQIDINGKKYDVQSMAFAGQVVCAPVVQASPQPQVQPQSVTTTIPMMPTATISPLPPAADSSLREIKPPMPGRIVSVKVKVGDQVKTNDSLLVLEAMKMQNEMAAPCAGVIAEVNVKTGDSVGPTTVLVRIRI